MLAVVSAFSVSLLESSPNMDKEPHTRPSIIQQKELPKQFDISEVLSFHLILFQPLNPPNSISPLK